MSEQRGTIVKTSSYKLWSWLFGNRDFIGLDIGSHSVKLVRLRHKKGQKKWELRDLAYSSSLPPDAIVGGRIKDFAAVINAIRQCVRRTDAQDAKCAIAVTGASVFLRRLSLPKMTQSEFNASVTHNTEPYFPANVINNFNTGGQILELHVGQDRMDALVAAAEKDIVNEYLTVAIEAGLKPVIVDVGIIAFLNIVRFNYHYTTVQSDKNAVICLDFGNCFTNVGIMTDNGKVSFSRHIETGGLAITREIQKHFNISYELAESYKTTVESNKMANQQLLATVKGITEKMNDAIITEIRQCVDFFNATNSKTKICHAYITGAAITPSLIHLLKRRLEINVEAINPFQKIAINEERFFRCYFDILSQKISNDLAIAVGLAMRGKGDDQIIGATTRINLRGKNTLKIGEKIAIWLNDLQLKPHARRRGAASFFDCLY